MLRVLPVPAALLWGPELASLCNDAWLALDDAAGRPGPAGRAAGEVLRERWPEWEPYVRRALAGEPSRLAGVHWRGAPQRAGETWEDVRVDVSFGPVPDDAGGIGGVLVVLEHAAGTAARPASDDRRNGAAPMRPQQATHPDAVALPLGEDRYRRFFEEGLTGDCICRPDGSVIECNPAFARIFGFRDVEAARQANTVTFFPDPALRAAQLERLQREGRLERVEMTLQRLDGSPVHVIANLCGHFDEHGTLLEIKGYLFDITAQKALEARLVQAQKLELVGRLAGGIAHDFNNLLTVIRGNAQVLLAGASGGDVETVEEIDSAAQRAAELTRQLLAFGRQQALEPQAVDLNRALGDMQRMLRRLVGDEIELELTPGALVWPASVDPGQLQQVVMNLAANARDAMPGGGRLRVSTRNRVVTPAEALSDPAQPIAPGEYVELEVSDSGTGMSPSVQARVFEPFFTTKEQGKGTGLGLSTVYGIVTQSGGRVWVESEAGSGSRFRLLLPRASEPPAETPRPSGPRLSDLPGGDETVLVVEDEPGVRDVVAVTLRSRGYRVLCAADGAEAVACCEAHPGRIDLLLSDVVMPGMSAATLHERLSRLRPAMRTVLMSGHTPETLARRGSVTPHHGFVQKPFTPDEVIRTVRAVLDGAG